MDNNKSNDPSSSKRSDLIIITPDELAKLGLFQQVQTAVKPAEKNIPTESSILSLKQKIRDKIQETTLREASQNKPKAVTNSQVQCKNYHATQQKIKNVDISSPAETCNLKSLPKDTNKPLASPMKQYPAKTRANKIDHSVKKPQLLDSSVSAKNTTVLSAHSRADSDSISSSSLIPGEKNVFRNKASVREDINRSSVDTNTSFDKNEDISDQTSYQESCKKEVTVISNTSVCFSDEDLKHLVSKAKSKYPRIETSTPDNDNLKITSPKEAAIASTETIKIPINKDIIKLKAQKEIKSHLESIFSGQINIGHNDGQNIISKNIPEINEDKNTTIIIENENIESLTNSKNDHCHKISQEIQKQLKTVPPKKRKILKNYNTTKETLSECSSATNTGFPKIPELVKNSSKGNVKKKNVNKSQLNITETGKGRGKGKYSCKSSASSKELRIIRTNIVKTYGRKTVENRVEIKEDGREDTVNKHGKIDGDSPIKSVNIAQGNNNEVDIKLDNKQNTDSDDKDNMVIDLTDDSIEASLDVSCKTPENRAPEDVIQNKVVMKKVSLPKKRGPTKKIIDTPKTESASAISPNDCHLSSEIKSEEVITSTPVPKKRGRKKKSERAVVEEPIKEIELEESRSGRKRKKINYFELENNMLENFDRRSNRRRKVSSEKIEQSEENSPKRIKVTRQNKGNSSISSMDDPPGKTDMDCTSQEESNLTSCRQRDSLGDSENVSEACKSDENTDDKKPNIEHGSDISKEPEAVIENVIVVEKSSYREDEPEVEVDKIGQETKDQNDKDKKPEEDINDSDDNAVKLESSTEQKIRGDEETRTVMNSESSAAYTNESKNKSEAEAVETEASNIPSSNTGHHSVDKSQATIDEQDMVVCLVCNKKVNNEEWENHKRKIHYNLAWRKGDPEVKLDDVHFVTETLTPILQEEKNLKCHNCAKIHKSVKHFITHMKECGGIVSSKGYITCAICQEELRKVQWITHKYRKHNNLAWRIGEPPLDLNDQNVVITQLNVMYKLKKPMHCEKCGTSKKSVIGFMSHLAQCGEAIEDVKVECHMCGRKVLPVSMQSHIKLVHEAPKKVKVQKTSNFFDVATTELSKRKAAQRANLAIDTMNGENARDQTEHYLDNTNFVQESFVTLLLEQELRENSTVKCKFKDCIYDTDKVTDLLQHMDSCQNKPEEYYSCKKCLFISDTEDEIITHLKTAHYIDIIDDDFNIDPLEEIEVDQELQRDLKKKMLNEKKKGENNLNYKIKPTFLLNLTKQPGRLFSEAYNYTWEFCRKYFSSDSLFPNLHYSKTDWKILDDDLIEEYFPKYGQSCDVAVKRVTDIENVLGHEYSFKKLELFKPECDKGTVTIFCGGPIHAMAWMPTPYTSFNSRQVLAVAPANDFDMKYLVNVHYNEASVIQFWDFGVLTNKQKMPEPKLMFCLAFDFGPVWHLEWCPSGCFDPKESCDGKMSRLGLIAVAGTDSAVYIYAIPALEEEQMGLIYKVKPLLKLCLVKGKENLLGKDKFYATKISWSMGQGHTYIAVGYSDGMVGLFDTDTKSVLLRCKDEDDVDVLLPYKFFQAHAHYISALTLIHLNNGRRWLLTGSFDRCSCVWDLHDGTKYWFRKCIVSDGVWLPNWMAYVTAADESSTNHGPFHMAVKSHRSYLYENVYATNSLSTVTSISSSSWLNGLIQCNSVGEIIAFFPHQLTYAFDSDKHLKSYTYVFGFTKLIDKHKNPQERVEEEIEKQKALKPVLKRYDSSESANHILAVKNCHYNKYEPTTYLEASEKYGLTFCDMKMDHFHDLQSSQIKVRRYGEYLELSKPNLYSMQAINKIAYNPNLQASLYYATGYQMGFVRVTYMKFLEGDLQIV